MKLFKNFKIRGQQKNWDETWRYDESVTSKNQNI